MTAGKQPDFISIAEYLTGEEVSGVKYEYLTIPSLKVLIFVEPETPSVTVHRAKPEGGFAVERYSGLDGSVPLPEVDASLPLAEVYERVTFAA